MTLAFVLAGADPPEEASRRGDSPSVIARSSALPTSDAVLAAHIREGDHEAFTTVFLAHYDGLCRFAASVMRHIGDAEEIVESVFARIWEHRHAFAPPAGIGAYLYAAVRNRALNAMRDARVRDTWTSAHVRDVEVGVTPGMSVPPTPPLAALEHEELGVALQRAIDALPEHRRTVLAMRWFGALSHAEIAAAIGASANAVEIQLRRALKELAASVPAYLRE